MMRRLASCLVGVLGLIVASVPLAAPSSAVVIQVSPGQSIQAALDAAQPGDTVMVAAGVYHESVVIRQDHITLQGAGATESGTVLEPPSTPTDSDCAKGSASPESACSVVNPWEILTG